MDLDALRHPRGPLPAAVYWRRRVVTLAALLLLGWLLARALGGAEPSGSALDPTGTRSTSPAASPRVSPMPSPAASPTPTVRPTPARTPGGPCGAADLRLAATADARNYPAGARPVLRLVVTNVAPVACVVDLGQPVRELRVRSGADRIWSSDDCAPGGMAQRVTLASRERREFSVTWSRRRSAPGCPANQPFAAPGTYQVLGRLGTSTVAGSTFTLAG